MPSDRNEEFVSEDLFRLTPSDLDIPSDLIDPHDEISSSATIGPVTEHSKVDPAIMALKTFTRPTSSGAPSIAAGFQFSIAPKAQAKLTRPVKYKEEATPPKLSSTHEKETGREETKENSVQNEAFPQRDHFQDPTVASKARNEKRPVETTEQASATVEESDANNSISRQQTLQRLSPQTENDSAFDLPPHRVSSAHSETILDKEFSPSPSERENDTISADHNRAARRSATPNEHQRIPSIKPKDQHGAQDAPRAQKAKEVLRTVISGRITKSRMPKDPQRRGTIPAPLHNVENATLSNEQILQLYLRNIHSEKDQAARRHRNMRNQIEQLVRVNSDYQKKLDETEQELEEREAQIEQQSAQAKQWKEQVLRFKQTLCETVKSHFDLRVAMDTLRSSSKNLPMEVKNLQTEIYDCQAATSSISAKMADVLQSAAQNHRTEVVSLETKVNLARTTFKDQAKQLRKEQAKSASLEAFIAREIKALWETKPPMSQDLGPLIEKLSSLENLITSVDKQTPIFPPDLTVNVPGVDHCLELLKTFSQDGRIDLSSLPSITAAVARVEDKLVKSISQSDKVSQIVSARTTRLETEIQTHGAALKKSIDGLKLCLDDQGHLKTSIAELEGAAKGHIELVTALKNANDFAQQQACIPQNSVRKLSRQIEEFQQQITEAAGKGDEQNVKDLEAQMAKALEVQKEMQSDYEKEKGFSTALRETLENRTQELRKKEEEVKELKVKHAGIEENLKQAQTRISQLTGDNEKKDKEVAKKTDELATVAEEHRKIKTAEARQCEAIEELQVRLNGKEEMQCQLDSVMQEKIKADAKIANLEQHVAKYEILQAECNRLADVERVNEAKEAELRNTFERNISLEMTNFKQNEELTELRKRLKEVQQALEATRLDLRARPSQGILESISQDELTPRTIAALQELSSKLGTAAQLSQEIPESLSQDVLTPGMAAAFNQMIEPDMLDENAFQLIQSQKSQQCKDQGHAALPLRRANQDAEELLPHSRPTSQAGAFLDLAASQRTTLVPETQPDPMDEEENDHHRSAIDRTSSLTPSSQVEELLGDVEEAIKAPRPDRGAATHSTLRNVLSMRSSQSDEMLLETQTEQDDSVVRKRTTRTAADVQSKATPFNDTSGSGSKSGSITGHTVGPRLNSEINRRPEKSQPPKFSPKHRRIGAPRESTQSLSGDIRSPLKDRDNNTDASLPNPPVKEKPRPNSTAKRQASSVDDLESSPIRSGKRMKRNPSALETQRDKGASSTKGQAAQQASSPKPMIRHSMPTGSKGSGPRTNGTTTGQPPQTRKTNKKSKSQAYDSRFGR